MSTQMELLETQLRNFSIEESGSQGHHTEVNLLKEENCQLKENVMILKATVEKLVEEKAEIETAKDRIEDCLHMEIQNNEISKTTIENLQAQIVWLHQQLQQMHFNQYMQ